jgi:hypothetical protein
MTEFATSAGHWYALDGTPCYTTLSKDGTERPTTLRDARKLALVPSVTTIIRQAAAPALEKWKRDQLMMAALTLPRRPHESEIDWLRRVEQDSQETGRKAADRGTEIHGAIERYYRQGFYAGSHSSVVDCSGKAIRAHCGEREWSAERSFAHELGYGGKVDLHCAEWIIDFKTKDGVEGSKLYDEHYMQLAAYRRALCPNARAGILFVDRTDPICLFIEADADKMASGLAMFDSLLSFWQAKTGYYPMKVAA